MNNMSILAFFSALFLGDLLAMDPQVSASLVLDLSAARAAAVSPAPTSARGRFTPRREKKVVETGFCHSCKSEAKPVTKLFEPCNHAFCEDCQRTKSMYDCEICPACPVCTDRNPDMPPLVCGHHICTSPCSEQWRKSCIEKAKAIDCPTCRQENNLQLARDTQCVSCGGRFTDADATGFKIVVTQCLCSSSWSGNITEICCFHQSCFVSYVERTAYWDEKVGKTVFKCPKHGTVQQIPEKNAELQICSLCRKNFVGRIHELLTIECEKRESGFFTCLTITKTFHNYHKNCFEAYIWDSNNRKLDNDRNRLLTYRCPVHDFYVRVGKVGQTLLDPGFAYSNDPKVIDEENAKYLRERARKARFLGSSFSP